LATVTRFKKFCIIDTSQEAEKPEPKLETGNEENISDTELSDFDDTGQLK